MKTTKEKQLVRKFKPSELDYRVDRAGISKQGKKWAMVFAHLDARCVQDRLDEVFGIFGWKDSYREIDGGYICRIEIKDEDGNWIGREDGAEKSKFEPIKGGLSGALKRAAVHFGIGRYVYNLPAMFVQIVDKNTKGAIRSQNKAFADKQNTKGEFYFLPPQLPSWALPEKDSEDFGKDVDNLVKELGAVDVRTLNGKVTEEQKKELRKLIKADKSCLSQDDALLIKNNVMTQREAQELINGIKKGR